jgi:phosphatidate cytidylyltransferase
MDAAQRLEKHCVAAWPAGAAAAVFALLWCTHHRVTPLMLAAGVAWWLLACLWLRHFAFGAAPTRENRAAQIAGRRRS